MGIEKITERREVADTARSYNTAVHAPDFGSAASSVAGGAANALRGLADGVKGIGAAIELKDNADADAAARDIRGYSDHVLNVGYRDPITGTQMRALRARTGEALVGVADLHDGLVQDFATKRLENLSERAKRLVSAKTHDYRTSTYHNLTSWSRDRYARFSIDRAGAEYSEDEDNLVNRLIANREDSSLPDAAKWIAENAEAASEVGEETASERLGVEIRYAAETDNAEARRDFDQFRTDLKRSTDELYSKYVNYGLVDPEDAKNRVKAVERKTIQRMFKTYLDNGHFDRALYFLGRGEDLGLKEVEISAGRDMLLEAARRKAEQVQLEVEKTKAASIKAARLDSVRREAEKRKVGDPDPSFFDDEAKIAEEAEDWERARSLRAHASSLRKSLDEGRRREAEQAAWDKVNQAGIDLYREKGIPTDAELTDYYERAASEMEGVDKRSSLSFLKAAAGSRANAAEQERREALARLRERKAEIAGNETGVRWDLLDLAYKMESGRDFTQDQLDLCRKMDLFRASRSVSPQFAEGFMDSMRKLNNAGVRRGLVAFARKCGVDFEQMADGGYSSAVRKQNRLSTIELPWSRDAMDGETFFRLSDRLQAQLESLKEDVSRSGAAEKIIDGIVQDYNAKGAQQAIDSIATTSVDFQIQQRALMMRREASAEKERRGKSGKDRKSGTFGF